MQSVSLTQLFPPHPLWTHHPHLLKCFGNHFHMESTFSMKVIFMISIAIKMAILMAKIAIIIWPYFDNQKWTILVLSSKSLKR